MGPTHLEAVLLRHDLLGLPLVDALNRAARGLGGRGPARGTAGALREVEVQHLHADLIADDVLELQGGGEQRVRQGH